MCLGFFCFRDSLWARLKFAIGHTYGDWMKMHIRIYLTLALLGLSLPAVAEFSTVTQAYEIALSDLRLPGNANGTLGFKSCSECASQTLKVRSDTRYVLNGRTVTLGRFKAELGRIRRHRDVAVTVLHHLESNVVTGVKVKLR